MVAEIRNEPALRPIIQLHGMRDTINQALINSDGSSECCHASPESQSCLTYGPHRLLMVFHRIRGLRIIEGYVVKYANQHSGYWLTAGRIVSRILSKFFWSSSGHLPWASGMLNGYLIVSIPASKESAREYRR